MLSWGLNLNPNNQVSVNILAIPGLHPRLSKNGKIICMPLGWGAILPKPNFTNIGLGKGEKPKFKKGTYYTKNKAEAKKRKDI